MFKSASLAEVAKLILSSPSRSCEHDHILTCLLNSCLHTLIIQITKLIHVSLSSAVFPSYFKHGHVNPLIKKPSSPANFLNMYRPISNISYIFKLLEKVIPSLFNVHINCNHLSNVSKINLLTNNITLQNLLY